MLATNIKPEQMKLPLLGSLKLEGVRAEFTPTGLYTRPMKRFGNPLLSVKFKKILDYCEEHNVIIEGEFYVHGMTFNEISSITRRSCHADTDVMEFHAFDMYFYDNKTLSFADRAEILNLAIKRFEEPDSIKAIKQVLHYEKDDIEAAYAYALDGGYEGYVLKSPFGSYKTGRSTVNEQLFVRMKAENTYDGIVTDIVERMTNLCESEENELGYMSKKQDKDMKEGTGMAAVAIVESKELDKPIRVTLSRGLSDADRAEIWLNRDNYIGKNIRFVGIPVKGMLPRSPRFDVWRTDLD